MWLAGLPRTARNYKGVWPVVPQPLHLPNRAWQCIRLTAAEQSIPPCRQPHAAAPRRRETLALFLGCVEDRLRTRVGLEPFPAPAPPPPPVTAERKKVGQRAEGGQLGGQGTHSALGTEAGASSAGGWCQRQGCRARSFLPLSAPAIRGPRPAASLPGQQQLPC